MNEIKLISCGLCGMDITQQIEDRRKENKEFDEAEKALLQLCCDTNSQLIWTCDDCEWCKKELNEK